MARLSEGAHVLAAERLRHQLCSMSEAQMVAIASRVYAALLHDNAVHLFGEFESGEGSEMGGGRSYVELARDEDENEESEEEGGDAYGIGQARGR